MKGQGSDSMGWKMCICLGSSVSPDIFERNFVDYSIMIWSFRSGTTIVIAGIEGTRNPILFDIFINTAFYWEQYSVTFDLPVKGCV